jgi:ParB/RepB/Spo0J family partition protein
MSKTLEIPAPGKWVEWEDENGMMYSGEVTTSDETALNVRLAGTMVQRRVRLDNPTLVVSDAPALPAPEPTTDHRPLTPAEGRRFAHLPLAEILPSPLNPRKTFAEEDLAELAESLQAHGVIQPVMVRPYAAPHTNGARWELIAGERRYRAATLIGLAELPAIIAEGLTDAQVLAMMIDENERRSALNPIEHAAALRRLSDLGWTQTQIAEELGMQQSRVAHRLSLLTLPPAVQEMIAEGRLSASHGEALRKWADFPPVCLALAEITAASNHPVKVLDDKLPFNWVLRNRKLIRAVDYYTPKSVKEECKNCPHQAFRSTGGGDGYCLLPEEYDRKVGEVNAATLARAAESNPAVKERLAAATGDGCATGTGCLKMVDLTPGAYEELRYRTIPAGCTEECPCRVLAESRYREGQLEPVCLDPKRFRLIQITESRDAGKRRKEAMAAKGARLAEALASPDGTARAFAVVAWSVLRGIRVEPKRATAAARLMLPDSIKPLFEQDSHRLSDERVWPLLADVAEDVRVGVPLLAELLAREKLYEAVVNQSDRVPVVDFLLGEAVVVDGADEGGPVEPALEACAACGNDFDARTLNEDGQCPGCARFAEGILCARCGDSLPAPIADAFEELLHAGGLDLVTLAHLSSEGALVTNSYTPKQMYEDDLEIQGRAMLTPREGVYCGTCAPNVDLCEVCGCTEERACEEGCGWAKGDGPGPAICTTCAGRVLPEAEAVTV